MHNGTDTSEGGVTVSYLQAKTKKIKWLHAETAELFSTCPKKLETCPHTALYVDV